MEHQFFANSIDKKKVLAMERLKKRGNHIFASRMRRCAKKMVRGGGALDTCMVGEE
jgi:hypothetical protein